MGAIQNSINQITSTVGSALAVGSYLKDQDTKRAEEVAVAENALKSNLNQYKFDTAEAAAAIKAHEPEFEEQIKDYDLKNLKDEQVQDLADKVEAFRAGKLTRDRIKNIEDAGKEYKAAKEDLDQYKNDKLLTEYENGANITPQQYKDAMAKEKAISRMDKAKTELNYAYDAERELNQRIEASRRLKFNIESARATIRERGGRK